MTVVVIVVPVVVVLTLKQKLGKKTIHQTDALCLLDEATIITACLPWGSMPYKFCYSTDQYTIPPLHTHTLPF